MQNEVLWRGKRLRIVSESWESQLKCEPCVCAGQYGAPCFDAPLDERGVGLECMQPRDDGTLHHWEEVP